MSLNQLRNKIDKIDGQLIALLAKRKEVVRCIGQLKQKQGLPIFNKAREAEITQKLQQLAKKFDLRPIFLQKVWQLIIAEAKVVQKKISK